MYVTLTLFKPNTSKAHIAAHIYSSVTRENEEENSVLSNDFSFEAMNTKTGKTEFRRRLGEDSRLRQLNRRVAGNYLSIMDNLNQETLKSLSDNDCKNLHLLIMRFRHDPSSIKIYPRDNRKPDTVLLMLPEHSENRPLENLLKAVKWRSWDITPRIYVIHRHSRSMFTLEDSQTPSPADTAGIILQWDIF